MNNIIYNDEVITPKDNIWNYYYDFTEKLDKKHCIKFALFCAKIVNPNTKESNLCIELVEKWLINENSVSKKELWDAAANAYYAAANVASYAYAANAAHVANAAADIAYFDAGAAAGAAYSASAAVTYYATASVYYSDVDNIDKMNKYLQILLRKTKQFQNNKILEQISKTDVDKLELVDWNMITDIMQEEYNIVHEFEYSDLFSRRCLIELLRREYA